METLAATRPPREMNRVAFGFYVCFGPDIARGAGHMAKVLNEYFGAVEASDGMCVAAVKCATSLSIHSD